MKTALTPHSFKTLLLMAVMAMLSVFPSGANGAAAKTKTGTEVNKTMNINEFSSVRAATGIEIVYTQGHFTGVAKVTTNTTAEKYLRITVKNGCLDVYFDTKGYNGNININGKTTVMVQSPVLKEIDLSSAARFRMEGAYSQNRELEIDLSSAASAYFPSITCTKLDLDLSSAATFTADNLQGNVELESSSASKANITNMKGSKLSVEVSSAANVTLNGYTGNSLLIQASSGAKVTASDLACKNADVSASSGGNVSLSGNCENLSTSNSSGGRIKNDLSVKRYANSSGDVNKDLFEANKARLGARKARLAAQRAQLEAQRKELDLQSKQMMEESKKIAKQSAKRRTQAKKVKSKKTKEKSTSDESGSTHTFVIP